jgi:hypothetical protein
LKALLPNRLPTALSTAPRRTAEITATRSGSEVTVAMGSMPTNPSPTPLCAAICEALRAIQGTTRQHAGGGHKARGRAPQGGNAARPVKGDVEHARQQHAQGAAPKQVARRQVDLSLADRRDHGQQLGRRRGARQQERAEQERPPPGANRDRVAVLGRPLQLSPRPAPAARL